MADFSHNNFSWQLNNALYKKNWAPLVAQRVKNLHAMQETQVRSLVRSHSRWDPRRSPRVGHGNPLQYSWWRIPWAEEPGGLQSMGSQRVRHD